MHKNIKVQERETKHKSRDSVFPLPLASVSLLPLGFRSSTGTTTTLRERIQCCQRQREGNHRGKGNILVGNDNFFSRDCPDEKIMAALYPADMCRESSLHTPNTAASLLPLPLRSLDLMKECSKRSQAPVRSLEVRLHSLTFLIPGFSFISLLLLSTSFFFFFSLFC